MEATRRSSKETNTILDLLQSPEAKSIVGSLTEEHEATETNFS